MEIEIVRLTAEAGSDDLPGKTSESGSGDENSGRRSFRGGDGGEVGGEGSEDGVVGEGTLVRSDGGPVSSYLAKGAPQSLGKRSVSLL